METDGNTRFWRHAWMLFSTLGIGIVISWLVKPALTETRQTSSSSQGVVPEAVRAEPGGLIEIAEDSPLQAHLTRMQIAFERVHFPALTVSGSILARITPGAGLLADRWQFSSSEMAAKYADWLKSNSEVDFARNQLDKTGKLVAAQTDYLSTNVKRLEPAAKSGSISEKEFRAAQAELIKAQLQGEKDIFAAQTALRLDLQSKMALEREMSQAGIDAAVLERPAEHIVLIVANVPESRVSVVHEGQEGTVRFYAYPDRTFKARVKNLSSLLTRERRTMRVLIELENPNDELRPGMFADVGLGTDEREAIRIPAEALLHYNLDDYVVVATEGGKWKPVAVHVGDQQEGAFEVRAGLSPGDTVITFGAILLKPTVIQVLRRSSGEKN